MSKFQQKSQKSKQTRGGAPNFTQLMRVIFQICLTGIHKLPLPNHGSLQNSKPGSLTNYQIIPVQNPCSLQNLTRSILYQGAVGDWIRPRFHITSIFVIAFCRLSYMSFCLCVCVLCVLFFWYFFFTFFVFVFFVVFLFVYNIVLVYRLYFSTAAQIFLP